VPEHGQSPTPGEPGRHWAACRESARAGSRGGARACKPRRVRIGATTARFEDHRDDFELPTAGSGSVQSISKTRLTNQPMVKRSTAALRQRQQLAVLDSQCDRANGCSLPMD